MSAFTYASYTLAATLEAGVNASATSIEVSRLSDGISAGDRVKVAIGPDVTSSFDPYTASAGELVYGVVGTIGAGANGGTDIDLSASEDGRGKEGTTAASHANGATCVVGVMGRDNAYMETAAVPYVSNAFISCPVAEVKRVNTNLHDQDVALATVMYFNGVFTPSDFMFEVRDSASTDGTLTLFVAGLKSRNDQEAGEVLIAESISGNPGSYSLLIKSITNPVPLHGLVWIGCQSVDYTTTASITKVTNNPILPQTQNEIGTAGGCISDSLYTSPLSSGDGIVIDPWQKGDVPLIGLKGTYE